MNTEKTENKKSAGRLKKSLKKHRKGIMAGCVVAVIAVAFVFGKGDSTEIYAEETAQLRDIYTYKSFVGNVEPASEMSIVSKVSQQVTDLYVEEGDTVRKGGYHCENRCHIRGTEYCEDRNLSDNNED